MAGVHNSLTWSQTDAIAEVLSAKSCHIVQVRSPPDYVEKISRYLESSTGQSKQDTSLNEPPGAESDSGDSLFITQKPVPQAVRSKRRLHYNPRSAPTTPSVLEESGSDTSSSSSDGESRTKRKSRRKKYRLPKYSFPFLSERKWKPTSTGLPVKQNTCLHNSAMGGFFNCVKETWQGSQKEDDLELWLPTVDTDGEYISPLSEEEERPEDEDIKVVEKKCFVAPMKAKNRHTWWDQLKEQTSGTAGNASHATPPGKRCKMLHKIPANAPKSRASPLSLDTESAVSGESSCRAWDEREMNDERMRTDADLFSSQEASKSKRHCPQKNKKVLHQQKDTEDELCDDSDATVCELNMLQRSPQLRGRGGSTTGTTTTTTTKTTTEPQNDDFPTNLSQTGQTEDEFESQSLLQSLPDLFSDSNNDHVCSEIRIKRRKRNNRDHESKEKEKGQSQDEPEGLHAAKSVNVGAKETARLSEDNGEEPVASQTNEGLKFNNNNCMESVSPDGTIVNQEVTDIPHKKQKKKKRKNFEAGNIRQEVDGNVDFNVRREDFVFSGSCNEENGSKDEKKKTRKRMDDNVKQSESNTTLKPLSDGAEKKKKLKKEEKIVVAEEFEQEKELNYTIDLLPVSTEQLEASRNGLENTAEYEEALEASYVNGKKHKKKQQSFSNDGEEGVGMSSKDNVTLEESTELIKKKKKKKKSMREEVDIFDNHEQNKKVEDGDGNQKTEEDLEDQNAEQATKKKKKKNKVSENSSNISKETVAQSNDSASARKREKKRTSSFLVADLKKKDAQTHEEQNFPSQSEAHVCHAEKVSVSTADFEAEISENFEESCTGIRKKKRKRKMSVEQECVERDHKLNFEATNETCQSATSEITETGVKRKKKQKRNESELTTPIEELESAPDAPVVLKRKKKKKKQCKDEPCHVIQKSPVALATEDSESETSFVNTCTSASPKKKGKHMTLPLVAQSKHAHNTDMSHDSSTSDQATERTLSMVEQVSSCSETPENQTLNGITQKKKKKKVKTPDSDVLEGTECAEVVPQENKKGEKKKRNKESSFLSATSSSPVLNEISLSKPENSESVKKKKHKKVKRTLHNANEDFLTDLQYEP